MHGQCTVRHRTSSVTRCPSGTLAATTPQCFDVLMDRSRLTTTITITTTTTTTSSTTTTTTAIITNRPSGGSRIYKRVARTKLCPSPETEFPFLISRWRLHMYSGHYLYSSVIWFKRKKTVLLGSCILQPDLRVSIWNIGTVARDQKTRMMVLPGQKRSLTISSAIWIQYTNVTDRRTERQTDGHPTTAKTALYA